MEALQGAVSSPPLPKGPLDVPCHTCPILTCIHSQSPASQGFHRGPLHPLFTSLSRPSLIALKLPLLPAFHPSCALRTGLPSQASPGTDSRAPRLTAVPSLLLASHV